MKERGRRRAEAIYAIVARIQSSRKAHLGVNGGGASSSTATRSRRLQRRRCELQRRPGDSEKQLGLRRGHAAEVRRYLLRVGGSGILDPRVARKSESVASPAPIRPEVWGDPDGWGPPVSVEEGAVARLLGCALLLRG